MTWFLQIKAHKDIAHFETAYVVKLHRIATLAPPQQVRSQNVLCVLEWLSDLITVSDTAIFHSLFF